MMADARALEGTPEAALARPHSILVADDEYLVANDLALTLNDLGYEVVGPASTGEAAVELARLEEPDLALLDIQMPRLDGLSAARQIFGELGIPVVIISAYSDPEYIEKAREAGVFGYLIKSASGNQLRAAIEVAWSRFARHAEARQEVEVMKKRLDERKIIERAKWILVQRKGLSEEEALRTLQRQSRQTRKRMAELAQQILDANELL